MIVTQSVTVGSGTYNYGSINAAGTSSFGWASNATLSYDSGLTEQVGLELRGYGQGLGPALVFFWEGINSLYLWNNASGTLSLMAPTLDPGYPASFVTQGGLTAGSTVTATTGLTLLNGVMNSQSNSGTFTWHSVLPNVTLTPATLDRFGNLTLNGKLILPYSNSQLPSVLSVGPTMTADEPPLAGAVAIAGDHLYFTNGQGEWLSTSLHEAYGPQLNALMHFENNSLSSSRGNIATFSRPTVAQSATNWTVAIGSNQPRFAPGWFGNGVLLEPAATNLAPDSGFVNGLGVWSTNNINGTTATLTVVTAPTYSGYAVQVVTDGNLGEGIYNRLSSLVAGQAYTASLYADLPAGCSMYFGLENNMVATVSGTGAGWQRYLVTGTWGADVNDTAFVIYSSTNSQGYTYSFSDVQLEATPYVTSYVENDGTTGTTRDADVLSYPAGTLVGSEVGSIAMWVYVLPAGAHGRSFLWQCGPDGGPNDLDVLLDVNNGLWLRSYNATSSQLVGAYLSTTGWTHVVAAWSSTSLTLYVNGQVLQEYSGPVPLPAPLASTLYVGGGSAGVDQVGTVIDELMCFNVALTVLQAHDIYIETQPTIDIYANSNATVEGAAPSTVPIAYDLVQYDANGNITASGIYATDFTVSGVTTYSGNLAIGGSTFATHNINAGGNIVISGTGVFDGGTTINGPVTVNSNMTVTQAMAFDSTLNVGGNTVIGGTLTVSGTTDLQQGLSVGGDVGIAGTTLQLFNGNGGATLYSDGNELYITGPAAAHLVYFSSIATAGTYFNTSTGSLQVGGSGQVGATLSLTPGGALTRTSNTLMGTDYFFYTANNSGGTNGTGVTLGSGTIATDTSSSYGTVVELVSGTTGTVFSAVGVRVPAGEYQLLARVRVSATTENLTGVYLYAGESGVFQSPNVALVNPSHFPDTNWHTLTGGLQIPAEATSVTIAAATTSTPLQHTNVYFDYVMLVPWDQQYSSDPAGVSLLANLAVSGTVTANGSLYANNIAQVGTAASTGIAVLTVNGGYTQNYQWGQLNVGLGASDINYTGGTDGVFTLTNTSNLSGAYTGFAGTSTANVTSPLLKLWNNGLVEVSGTLQVDGNTFTVGPAGHSGYFKVDNTNGVNPWFGLYDGSIYYGISANLPAPNGTSTLGGYYTGLGIGGSSNGSGQPIFGVLTNAQSGNGLGHVALTVYDTNEVVTYNNVLDNASGDMQVAGTLTTGAITAPHLLLSGTTPDVHLTDTSSGNQWRLRASGTYAFLENALTNAYPFSVSTSNGLFSVLNTLDDGAGNVELSGRVRMVDSVYTSAASPVGVASNFVSASNTSLSGYNASGTLFATNYPAFAGTTASNFLFYVYYNVLNATTDVTLTLNYHDGAGAQSQVLVDNLPCEPGAYTVNPLFFCWDAAVSPSLTLTYAVSTPANVNISYSLMGV